MITSIPTGPWLQKPLHATLSDLNDSHGSLKSVYNGSTHSGEYSSLNNEVRNLDSPSFDSSTRSNSIGRHLTLFDLVSIGVGGTIGSGIFVLNGYIAHNYAGPATVICWAISGLSACLSGVCYGELSSRMPAAGSSYVYVYTSMGELPAVIVAGCLTLEYVVSAAAVARSWGDKVISWVLMQLRSSHTADENGNNYSNDDDNFALKILSPGYNFNPLSMLIAACAVFLLLGGVKESKSVTNFFTMTKVAVVVFMASVGLILIKPRENLTPFLPPQFGVAGIFRGATSSFFGYIGFDEICCMAGEAKDPQRNIPLAIIFSLGGVCVLYITAAIALTGMQSYEDISDVSGFPIAFASRNWDWAAQISAFGEVLTLPIVVLISLMAQPRLQYALARDGLLPGIFSMIDNKGNLWYGTLISGSIMVFIASFVPFDRLNDMISAGILLAFCLTDSSLLLMRIESPDSEPFKVEHLLAIFNFACLVLGVIMAHFYHTLIGKLILGATLFYIVKSFIGLWIGCSPVVHFGGKTRRYYGDRSATIEENAYFKTPWLPFVPCLGILINWYLIGQLELFGICLLFGFILTVTAFYFGYSRHHSVGNNGGWNDEGIPCRNNIGFPDYHDNNDGSEVIGNDNMNSMVPSSLPLASHGQSRTDSILKKVPYLA